MNQIINHRKVYLKIDNTLMASENIGEVNFYNKVKLMSHIGNYDFKHNPNLNDNVLSKVTLSSDIFYNLVKTYSPELNL